MKKYYALFITVIMASASLSAQNLVYSPIQHSVETIVDTSFEYYKTYVTTPNPEAVTFKWIRTGNTLPPSWNATLCDWTTCYIGVPSSGTMSAISLSQATNNNTRGFFALTIVGGSTYGSGKLSFYVYDAADINRGDTITFIISNVNTTGITESTSASALSIYPNPAKNNIKFNNKSNKKITVEIYNSLGKIVLNQTIFPHQTPSIDVSKLNRGIYFVSSIDMDGNKSTERLILQ